MTLSLTKSGFTQLLCELDTLWDLEVPLHEAGKIRTLIDRSNELGYQQFMLLSSQCFRFLFYFWELDYKRNENVSLSYSEKAREAYEWDLTELN